MVEIRMLRRALYVPVFHIDTNMINAKKKLRSMNQIEKWAEDDVIPVNMSEISFKEAQKGNNLPRTLKALSQIFTLIDDRCNESDSKFQRIANSIFPDGIKIENQKNDVMIIWHASKYEAILITNDGGSKRQPGGILGNAHKLTNIVKIFNATDAVTFIRKKIQERDDHNRKILQVTGQKLPEWTGKD
jgi:hypothetical protein